MSTLELKELSHPSGEVIKIASGKTLDLHSQGTTKMPAGSVIQVITKTHSQNASVSTTASSYQALGSAFELAITPKYANSIIVVEVDSGMAYATSNAGLLMNITKAGSVMYSDNYPFYHRDTSGNLYSPVHLTAQGVAGGTSAITYGVSFLCDGSGTVYAYHGTSSYNIKLTEIKQ